MNKPLGVLCAALLFAAACSADNDTSVGESAEDPKVDTAATAEPAEITDEDASEQPVDNTGAPSTSDVGFDQALQDLVDGFGPNFDATLIETVVAHGERSAGWLLSDLMRFYPLGSETSSALASGLGALGFEVDASDPWSSSTNQLIAEDVPAPSEYDRLKVEVLTQVDDRWQALFSSPVDMDFRLLNWGGVFIDDREFGDSRACFVRGCIPALDFPATTNAAGGSWYSDDAIVFGIVVDGEARAYPKHQMQVHEMVNDVIAGRRVAIPYCTLCGSAQAYFTDDVVDEPLVMRTSGLLSRSNKVMYDLNSQSIFDTFTGRATTGVHLENGVRLEQLTVRVATWGEWREAHPETTIVAADGGVGRVYPEDPLGGRDDDGPIFPIGDVDDRLEVQAPVIGVESPTEGAVAFAVADLDALDVGESVAFGGVTVTSDGAGYIAVDGSGVELATHEAFWFAWSQFWPDTLLWSGGA